MNNKEIITVIAASLLGKLALITLCASIFFSTTFGKAILLNVGYLFYTPDNTEFMEMLTPYDEDWMQGKTKQEILDRYGPFDYSYGDLPGIYAYDLGGGVLLVYDFHYDRIEYVGLNNSYVPVPDGWFE